jgi:multidrug efflux pump subunit AcrA (membrane-fusion protein)
MLAALAALGCHHQEVSDYQSVSKSPTVRLIAPPVRTIVRVVGQPSFIEAYERSSVYPKMNAYIQQWKVDIGDTVKKDQPLAYLFVPELVEEHGAKQETVGLDRERVELARKEVQVAEADVEVAQADLEEARAKLASDQAEAERWDSEAKRLEEQVKLGVVTPQDSLQATNRWKKSIAARDAAKATVLKAGAKLFSRQAALSQARVDVRVAEADVKVAESEERRLAVLVGYLTLPAPFDGVIVARNANTFDFVLPTTGDPTAMPRAPYLSPSGAAAPIYVVDRTDIVRIFVEIPERDADYVKVGTKATVLVRAYRDEPIPGTVTRTAWALNIKTRTLRAEIDLPNRGSQLLPGMYAYSKVIIERPGVHALPVTALVHVGEKTFCWRYENGHAARLEIETGVSDGQWIEVTNRRVPASDAALTGAVAWTPIDGSERVILGDLSILTEGTPVTVAPATDGTRMTNSIPENRPTNTDPEAIRQSVGSSPQAIAIR